MKSVIMPYFNTKKCRDIESYEMSNVQINPQKQEELGLGGIMRFICGVCENHCTAFSAEMNFRKIFIIVLILQSCHVKRIK